MTEPPATAIPVSIASAGCTCLTLTPANEPPPLRADAARNRKRLLEVAAELAAERGAANVTMEAIAAAAEVGKGTVFRRFGDRTGLMLSLVDHIEQRLQAAFLTGPPPLGPDAAPVERLRAFGPAVIRHEHAHRDLYMAARREDNRRFNPPYQVRLTHLVMLLRRAGAPGDAELTGHTLQAYLDTVLVQYLLTARSMPVERLDAGWYDLVDRLGTPR
ncbi:TetR/AcrR family transcriptional regulator [Streptomyces sp. ME01-24h]|nr:TetR/AcrR family transcriptional regulator [Streptomyces sp. ME19-03-3]MDX3352891.1 TetR/AcrR family transcriptional regulator [Streptomyces sp. ME01-24h]